MKMKYLVAGICMAASLGLASAGANALTLTTNGPVAGGVVPIGSTNVYTMEIGGDAADSGGSYTFGFLATSNLISIETNSLNPIAGFAGAVVKWTTAANGLGSVLGQISGASLAAGDELILPLIVGQTYWLTAFWSDVTKDGSNFDLRIETSPVPVPAALPLLASGLLGMGYLARRRKNKLAA